MHFFNPAPLMKLVEVVSGLRTDRAVADAVFELRKAWGKTPVHARSTPGFIVNRVARPYYGEALRAAARALRDAGADRCRAARRGGFRMGPCELMDLIGHDVNFAVTESVYEANFFDDRATCRRWCRRSWSTAACSVARAGAGSTSTRSRSAWRRRRGPSNARSSKPIACVAPTAVPRCRLAAEMRTRDIAVFDWQVGQAGGALAYAVADGASESVAAEATESISAAGFEPVRIGDAPGLVVARTVSMLINEAADAVQQGVCEPQAADAAMKLGVNYPAGPFEWLERIGAAPVIGLLETLGRDTLSERYRVSGWLRHRSAIGIMGRA